MLSSTIMGIVIKFLDEFKEDYGLVIDIWNDNITFVAQKKWKMWTQKICQSSVKINIKKLSIIKWKIY
jgi:hypothetical protein